MANLLICKYTYVNTCAPVNFEISVQYRVASLSNNFKAKNLKMCSDVTGILKMSCDILQTKKKRMDKSTSQKYFSVRLGAYGILIYTQQQKKRKNSRNIYYM